MLFDGPHLRKESILYCDVYFCISYAKTLLFKLDHFGSYQQLANKYNSIIIRVYGAAGHGRGLIDDMSSFGVKGILRRSIIGKDIFFADSNEIKEYLESIGDERMLYRVVDETELYPAKQHLVENQIKIKPCQKNALVRL